MKDLEQEASKAANEETGYELSETHRIFKKGYIAGALAERKKLIDEVISEIKNLENYTLWWDDDVANGQAVQVAKGAYKWLYSKIEPMKLESITPKDNP